MRSQTRLAAVMLALLIAVVLSPSLFAADVSIVTKEVSLGVAPDGVDTKSLVISPDNSHVAYVVKAGETSRVYMDGKPEKEYAEIWGPIFSPDGKLYAYIAETQLPGGVSNRRIVVNGEEGKAWPSIQSTDLIFSPDSKRLAYTSIEEGWARTVHADGLTSLKTYKKEICCIDFSPDSKHIAYVVGGTMVVVDSTEEKQYDGIRSSLVFSPDSKRIAYVAELDKRMRAVIDGVDGREYDKIELDSIQFSPDSKRVAYLAETNGRQRVVVDGVQGREYEEIPDSTVEFSPDSKHVVHVAKVGEKGVLVVDGVEGKPYDNLSAAVFSADGKRIAYAARIGDKLAMVVDGIEGEQFDDLGDVVFSPDGKRLAYRAKIGEKQAMVIDGRRGQPCDDNLSDPIFTPDGRRIVYGVGRANKAFIADNGIEGKAYEDIRNNPEESPFSPDGKYLVFFGLMDGRWRVVANGVESQADWQDVGDIVYDGPTKFHFIGQRGREFFRVEAEIKPTK